MIEVEKKFIPDIAFAQKVRQDGKFINRKVFQDSYYDTADWFYTLQNIWLRKRGDVYELKVGVKKQRGLIDIYHEIIADTVQISKVLNLSSELPFSLALEQKEFISFCTFQTQRSKYQLGEFIIDVDVATCGDLIYTVAEVELLVSEEKDIPEAEAKVVQFLEQEKINWQTIIQAKVPFFLSHNNPKHYSALIKAQVFKE